MDQVFHADHAVLAEVVFNQLIVGEGNALLVDLAVSSLVDQLPHRLEVGIAVGNEWVDDGEHLLRGLGDFDKDTVVDLEETEELEDLSWFGSNLVDTAKGQPCVGA